LDLLQFFADRRPHSPNNSPNINRYGAGGGDPQNRIVASFSADESGIKSVVQGVAMTQMTKALGYQDVASLFMRDAAQRHLV
jgi:hypothetical protein